VRLARHNCAVEREYQAPWGRVVRIGTGATLVLLGLIAAFGLFAGPGHLAIWSLVMVGGPLVVIATTLPFMVRGYRLTSRNLVIHRLGFDTTLPLDDLRVVRGIGDEARGSLRLWGNGGLFAITGWFWNRKLGRYRVFATDLSRAVLLEFARRKVLVTPHDPQAFLVHARKLLSMR
jgi:hypothetical protein